MQCCRLVLSTAASSLRDTGSVDTGTAWAAVRSSTHSAKGLHFSVFIIIMVFMQ